MINAAKITTIMDKKIINPFFNVGFMVCNIDYVYIINVNIYNVVLEILKIDV